MQKHLYFVCPTDYLETVINRTFQQENYYYTSLGNSILFDNNVVEEINGLIAIKKITAITFVLSNNNQVVMDVLNNQDFYQTKEFNKFHHTITQQKEQSKILWQTDSLQVPVLSYYLNTKVKELAAKLNSWLTIDAKIYNKERNTFSTICPDMYQQEYFNLN